APYADSPALMANAATPTSARSETSRAPRACPTPPPTDKGAAHQMGPPQAVLPPVYGTRPPSGRTAALLELCGCAAQDGGGKGCCLPIIEQMYYNESSRSVDSR